MSQFNTSDQDRKDFRSKKSLTNVFMFTYIQVH